MFDSIIQRIRNEYGVWQLSDWGDIRPEWILDMPGAGEQTLNHIRLYLATRGVTLKDDQTPKYWKANIKTAHVTGQITEDDCRIVAPFTVVIDSQEKQPFGFQSITCDSRNYTTSIKKSIKEELIEPNDVKFIVPIEWKSLGVAGGDYSIAGFEKEVSIERKSAEDAIGTFLGWGDRRRRFEAELENLACYDWAAVVVECSFKDLLLSVSQHGKKTKKQNQKILHRQIIAWQQDFRLPWFFCDDRSFAEKTSFRFLQRFWRKRK